MVILSISKLNNKQYAGININIPKYVKNLNKFCKSAYLDMGNVSLKNFYGYKYYFTKNKNKNFKLSDLPVPFNKPDIVVFQTLYVKEFIEIYIALKKNNIPYTIIPRCSMTSEAQKRKKIKKIVGNLLFYNKFIKEAAFIHFLTENEKKQSTNFKFKNSVVIGNGIEKKKKIYNLKSRKEYKVVYIGRYDIYHKGLDVMLDAIYKNKIFFEKENIHFYLYGPDFENNLSILTKKCIELGLEKILFINNAIFDEEKEKVLLDSDVFIQTSRLEGHPTGVIEAISYGIPVIVTPGTNFAEDVKNFNLGYTANFNSESISSAIIKSYKEKYKFKSISQNAIQYSDEHFDWNKISKKIIDEYSTIIGK